MEGQQEQYGGEERRKSQQGYMGDNRRKPKVEMPFEEDLPEEGQRSLDATDRRKASSSEELTPPGPGDMPISPQDGTRRG